MRDLSDAELVRRAQNGIVNAIGILYDRHHERIFRYIWMRVRDQQVAEDLTGEVFTRMVSDLPRYRLTGAPFQAWLYRVAHNLVIDYYRKESDITLVPLYQAEDMNMEKNDPVSAVEHRFKVEQVQRALDTLDPAQRNVVVLRFLIGLSLQESALTLGKTVASVKSLQHRGLKALRAALQQGQGERRQ